MTEKRQKTARGKVEREDFHEEDVIDKPFDRGLATRMLAYVRPYTKLVGIALVLILLSTGFQLLGPVLVREAIDGPLTNEGEDSWFYGTLKSFLGIEPNAEAGGTERVSLLWMLLVVYLGVLLMAFVTRLSQTWVMHLIGQNVMRDLRMKVFKHLQQQSLKFYQEQPVGRLITRVTSDVESLNELFTSGLVTFVGDILTVVGIIVVMFLINAKLAALAMVTLPALVGITLLFRYMARRHYRENRRTLAHLNAFTQESIIGLEVIQISRREDARAQRYEEINEGYYRSWLKSVFWYSVFFPSVEICSYVSLALVLNYAGGQIELGLATFGEFFLFWSFLNRFFVPIRDLADKYNLLQRAMASSERVFGVLDADTALPRTDRYPAKPVAESVHFDNVWFAYEEDNHVLKDVDFTVKPGETVAVVGATGAGKSTIVNLLLRFHDTTTGAVRFDGVDVREISLAEHRARFGLVLQDVAIFTRDVEANIDLDRGISMDDLRDAARQVQADRFIERLEGKYSEPMLERGRNLSSGERQLLAFARALAGDPEILVLDEATSHIDGDTEALIQQALQKLTEGRTSIVIAHRLSTIRNADRILVLHHGELRESGTHEELLRQDGIYARLYRLQFAAGEVDQDGAA